jgi:hypothetical protein
VEILRTVLFVAGLFGAGCLWVFVMNPRMRAMDAQEKERAYQRRVEAKVAELLEEERFGADVRRRLEAARSTAEIREEV